MDDLRTGCVERAKRRRREELMEGRRIRRRFRGGCPDDGDDNDKDTDGGGGGGGCGPSTMISSSISWSAPAPSPTNSAGLMHTAAEGKNGGSSTEEAARRLVEEEYEKWSRRRKQPSLRSDGETDGGEDEDYGVPEVTEEEVMELVREVEEELVREEEFLEEELHELERAEAYERERTQDQIDDYERWEVDNDEEEKELRRQSLHRDGDGDDDGDVSCPVCRSASLVEPSPGGVIICPNNYVVRGGGNRAAHCPLRLDVARDGLTLSHLRERLRNTTEDHARKKCPAPLEFRIIRDGPWLAASCGECGTDEVVL